MKTKDFQIFKYNSKNTNNLYHLSHNDLCFHLVRITENNFRQWSEEFINKGYFAYRGRSEGVGAFSDSINYYKTAEVWVAYAANRFNFDANIIDKESIEMIVSVSTSDDAPFTTHMGISRAYKYSESHTPHKNLAMDLHSFAAKAVLEHYGDKKQYMITHPTDIMFSIMYIELLKKGLDDHIQVGNGSSFDCKEIDEQSPFKAIYLKQYTELKENIHNIKINKSSNTEIIKVACNHDYAIAVKEGRHFQAFDQTGSCTKIYKKEVDEFNNNIRTEICNIDRNQVGFEWFNENGNLHFPPQYRHTVIDNQTLSTFTSFVEGVQSFSNDYIYADSLTCMAQLFDELTIL